MMRRKQVEKDGASLLIAPLTMVQVEELIHPVEGTEEGKARALDIICAGLNNAGADPPWTPERARSEMDLVLFQFLQGEILEFSGLKLVQPAGELGGPES